MRKEKYRMVSEILNAIGFFILIVAALWFGMGL